MTATADRAAAGTPVPSAPAPTRLAFRSVSKRFPMRGGRRPLGGRPKGTITAVEDLTFTLEDDEVVAIIGPSGCGKSTFIRCLNRMNDLIAKTRVDGSVLLEGKNIYDPDVDVVHLRRRIGMVFQKPNPFPKTIYENIAYAPRIHGLAGKKREMNMDDIVEDNLKKAGLWKEVVDRLHAPALSLSGGQQQRLCIARAIALEPEVVLMDEPASSLDPTSTAIIEDLIDDLKKRYCIVIVTHNMQQASRISDYTSFFYEGEVIETDETEKMFTNPSQEQTQNYIEGRFG
jgi:phosphate transport system ATP-binding protein